MTIWPRAFARGRFREDLYYRLAVIPIHLPPLRSRGGDILLIATRFLDDLSKSYGLPRPELTMEAQLALAGHAWPGNIRELRNVIERGLLMSEGAAIRPEHLALVRDRGRAATDPAVRDPSPIPFPSSLRSMEEAAARTMVEVCKGNKSDAARQLGITRSRLYSLLQRAAEEKPKPVVMT